jgi:hypothetical protein
MPKSILKHTKGQPSPPSPPSFQPLILPLHFYLSLISLSPHTVFFHTTGALTFCAPSQFPILNSPSFAMQQIPTPPLQDSPPPNSSVQVYPATFPASVQQNRIEGSLHYLTIISNLFSELMKREYRRGVNLQSSHQATPRVVNA